jgi:hypothetical protein
MRLEDQRCSPFIMDGEAHLAVHRQPYRLLAVGTLGMDVKQQMLVP